MNELEYMKIHQDIESKYMNKLQLRAAALDTNILIARVARGTGKSEGILVPRIIKVADSMPGELSFLVHKTYVALMTNIVPNLRSIFAQPTASGKALLEEGVDYVIGTAKLPSHFISPRYPISFPRHSIVFRNGHNIQLVSSDVADSVAGRSATHAFIEEMKHQNGSKLKSRIFPALRGGFNAPRNSPYFGGITGITDAARLDLGEDNWYDEFEANVDKDLLDDIVTIALHVDGAKQELIVLDNLIRGTRNPLELDKYMDKRAKALHIIAMWQPNLNEMRSNATAFLTASTFVNKDVLGFKYFQNQFKALSQDEFLSSICNIVQPKVTNAFFVNFNKSKHCYSDSYKYAGIMNFNLNDDFKLTADYLKYYSSRKSLLLGFDPGNFASLVVGQENTKAREMRIIKNFTIYTPATHAVLAKDFNDFFGSSYNKELPIILYCDRAGNKKKREADQITTDAISLKKELEYYGYNVQLMTEKQRTIFYFEHYRLLLFLLGEEYLSMYKIRIDDNECADLVSSIQLSPITKTDNKIELDKTSERKVPLHRQAALTTQLSSALMYLLFGRYHEQLPDEYKRGVTLISYQ